MPTKPEFIDFLDRLAEIARGDAHVLGLVGFGSTANLERVDEWSDHDFAWVTVTGAEDRFRHDLSWLPDADRIALSVVEWHGGVKVVYDNGHVLEFGIADPAGFAGWLGSSGRVIVDKGGIADALDQVHRSRPPEGAVDAEREIRLVLTQLLIGCGRARRGELLSAGRLIREDAVGRLLAVLASRHPDPRLDSLDPFRRVELAHPDFAARLAEARELPPEPAARAILELAEQHLAPGWDLFPWPGVAAVRARLAWE